MRFNLDLFAAVCAKFAVFGILVIVCCCIFGFKFSLIKPLSYNALGSCLLHYLFASFAAVNIQKTSTTTFGGPVQNSIIYS
jgi:hypothetical protein